MSSSLVERSASFLAKRTSRRGFLIRTAVVGSVLAVSPARWILRPGTAYAAVCGPSASCGSGFTAMCCTVSGANRCPPGSIPAGWWKADNSGYCCGNTARYYIDCNMQCRCGCSGGAFCRQSCVDCSCHCASGTCDQRRVCCNYFRYGQCHQEVGCIGPILCRVVTCVPPWQFDRSCGTTSATDNATAQHTAPCLAGPCRSAIDAHWHALGGEASFLASPVAAEQVAPGGTGRFRHYRGGSIYWSPATGAREVHGAIRERWAALGWERSHLGYPIDDERATPDGIGRFSHFQGGSIYWSPATGAHEVHGDIRAKWAALGWERSILGYPVSDVGTTADGGARYARFEHGSIYGSPATGVHEIHGAIEQRYREEGGSQSTIGLPVTDVVVVPAGLRSYFVGGVIHSDRATGDTGIALG